MPTQKAYLPKPLDFDFNNRLKLNFFDIKPRSGLKLDPLVADALDKTSREFLDRRKREAGKAAAANPFADVVEEFTTYVRKQGISNNISLLTAQINKSGYEDTVRQLLATKGIFEYTAIVALKDQKVNAKDLKGLQHAIELNLEGGPTSEEKQNSPKGFFNQQLVDKFLAATNSSLKDKPALYQTLIAVVRNANVTLAAGKTQLAIQHLLDRVGTEGNLPAYVQRFAEKGEIPAAKFTAAIRVAMVKYLLELDLPLEEANFDADFTAGSYDEYFANAYYHATRVVSGDQDPLASKFTKSNIVEWDFSVDQFDTIVDQGIIPTNILAAGALYYVYVLGENLGIYRLADALVLRWARGQLDITDGEAASKLYNYWGLRKDRSSPEERGLLYKRILNFGDTRVLRGMVENEAFSALWHKLMEEATEFIRRSEENSAQEEKVSRAKIFEATRNLQYNLTSHMTGMGHLQTQEMYAYLTDAMAILSHPDVVDFFGGGRSKNMWKVIERLAVEDFGSAPNIAAIRTAAVEGNKVFQWVAKFDGAGRVIEEDFRAFLESAEAWILAQASQDLKVAAGIEDRDEEDDEESDDDEKDDFDDWDK